MKTPRKKRVIEKRTVHAREKKPEEQGGGKRRGDTGSVGKERAGSANESEREGPLGG